MRRLLFVTAALFILFLDQASKWWSLHHLIPNLTRPWLDHILYLTLTDNPRGAFSLFPFPPMVFILFTMAVLGGIAYFALAHPPGRWLELLLGMLAGGGLGNLLDRMRYGYVVDFLDLRWWPVFNVADSAISVSIVLLAAYLFLQPGHKR